jgi:hypothetical protein
MCHFKTIYTGGLPYLEAMSTMTGSTREFTPLGEDARKIICMTGIVRLFESPRLDESYLAEIALN